MIMTASSASCAITAASGVLSTAGRDLRRSTTTGPTTAVITTPKRATSRGATIAASATGGSVASGTRPPSAGLARSRDVTRQVVTELGGVVVRQVDLVGHAFEGELNCRNVLGFLTGEVVDEGDDGLLGHGTDSPYRK